MFKYKLSYEIILILTMWIKMGLVDVLDEPLDVLTNEMNLRRTISVADNAQQPKPKTRIYKGATARNTGEPVRNFVFDDVNANNLKPGLNDVLESYGFEEERERTITVDAYGISHTRDTISSLEPSNGNLPKSKQFLVLILEMFNLLKPNQTSHYGDGIMQARAQEAQKYLVGRCLHDKDVQPPRLLSVTF